MKASSDSSDSKVGLIKAVTGQYQLLAVFLTVFEGLLGYWLHRAESGNERGIVGLVMVLILLAFLYVVVKIAPAKSGREMAIKPPAQEASATEIAAPAADLMSGPDRSYLINGPPEGWVVQELTLSEWFNDGLNIQDPATKEKLFPSAGQEKEILVFRREKQTSVIPIFGRTIVNGRTFPTALETLIPTKLSIVPVSRAQPPSFIEGSLENNFLVNAGAILGTTSMIAARLESSVIQTTGRRYLSCDLQQKVQNAIVNGKEGQDVVITLSIMAIEGELHDLMLLSQYATVQGEPDTERSILQGLVDSFKPAKIGNIEEKRRKLAALANDNVKRLLAEQGQAILSTELEVLLLRLKTVDLGDPEMLARSMKLLKPFEAFAREINLHHEKLDPLWEALHRAEKGDATGFKAELNELIEFAGSAQPEQQQAGGAALAAPQPVAETS